MVAGSLSVSVGRMLTKYVRHTTTVCKHRPFFFFTGEKICHIFSLSRHYKTQNFASRNGLKSNLLLGFADDDHCGGTCVADNQPDVFGASVMVVP